MNDILIDLARYGEPTLFLMSRIGWHCSLQMKINITGACFKVEATDKTPEAAVAACQKNMQAALVQLSTLKTAALTLGN